MIIEDTEILSDQEKQIISKEHFWNIPLYHTDKSTTEKFPFYGHTLSLRPHLNYDQEHTFTEDTTIQVTSEFFFFYRDLVDRFCSKHQIRYKNIIRSAINSTYYIPEYKFADPHVDFTQNHLVFLLYLNDPKNGNVGYNSTVIFDNEYSKDKPLVYDLKQYDQNSFKIKREVFPELGKILCFDGKYYHANKMPNPGEFRFVCVFNLLI